jgi:phosphate starvation-inducible PhoH-like protein
MRGRNFHNAFIVADECQNASYDQIKMLLTRIGNNSKMVLTGDTSQSDLIRHMQGGFYNMTQALTDVEGIGISKLDFSDIVRHPIIGKIIARLDSYENEIDKR